ncbi:MAG: hypothetical protein DMD81_26930 [Candidatus Rokuibacteriota bacterium]|nr:MAG: hypothetical protein DMD81_26930 [Candidatus Rokubacteria bacterium]
MPRVLYVVSRENPALFEHLGRTLQTATVEVTFDRRTGERRRQAIPPPVERRVADRRLHRIDEDLKRFGWAEVVLPDTDRPESGG